MINIQYYKHDAEGFKEVINHIYPRLISLYDPEEISIVRIKNWFDHKWLNYSGKKIEIYDTKTHPGIPFVLKPYWNEGITVPPFNPNRVLSEQLFRLKHVKNKAFEEVFHFWQRSTNNRNNFISEKTQNGLCLWISSHSVQNRQGSLMVYSVKNRLVESWYATIAEHGLWKVTQTKGISKKGFNLCCQSSMIDSRAID